MKIEDNEMASMLSQIIDQLASGKVEAMDMGNLKRYQIEHYKNELHRLREDAFDIRDQVRRDYVWTNRTIS